MDQIEQDLSRFKKPAMAAVGGIAAALVVATLPPVYLEKIIGFTGISEIISAAAPPLGNTARGLIAAASGLVSASAIYIFINRKGGSDMSVALREQINIANPVDPNWEEEKKSKFSLPKLSLNTKSLTRFLKKPKKKPAAGRSDKKVMDLADLPKLRESDAHPDAPVKRPLSAEQDLGTPLQQSVPEEMASQIKPFEQPEQLTAAQEALLADPTEMPAEAPMGSLTVPPLVSAAVPEPATRPEVVLDRDLTAPVAEQVSVPLEQPVAAPTAPAENMSDLSIAELADRLEAGLARLKQLDAIAASAAATVSVTANAVPEAEQSPVAQPVETQITAIPSLKPVEKTEADIQSERQADMDAALKAALGTLEKMTAQR